MELSNVELGYIINELNITLASYYVSNIQYIDGRSVQLRLHHSLKPEQRLIISAKRGLWLTRCDLAQDHVSSLLSLLRKELVRARINGISQPDSERIVFIDFESQLGLRKLIAEFFGEGNIVLTNEDGKILGLLRSLKVRHRELRSGGVYNLPPSRGLDVTKITFEDLKPLQSANFEAVRWMGRNISLSKKYIDEIFTRSKISFNTLGTDLTDEGLQILYDRIREILSIFSSKAFEPVVLYLEGRPVDASPIMLNSYSNLDFKKTESFQKAVDEIFTAELLNERASLEIEPTQEKLKELEVSIVEQQKAKEDLREKSDALYSIARRLANIISFQKWKNEDIANLLLTIGADSYTITNGKLFLSVKGYTLELDVTSSLMSISSQIYNKAKEAKERLKAIEVAEKDLIAKRDDISKMAQSLKAKRDVVKHLREKAWFERFRWFFTSEGLLSIGGRDASSNSAIVRKHTEMSDLVFHADLYGSPFFILKKGNPDRIKSILESAQAVVSFSSAWKDGYSSADAYWVKANQVKKQAPSGMYLAKGSFLIEGTKNYLKNVEVKVSVGVSFLEENLVVVCGPPSAIEKNSIAYLTLISDKVRTSSTAKQIKTKLIQLLQGELADRLKKLSIDEFIRAMPSGGGKIVSGNLGTQNY